MLKTNKSLSKRLKVTKNGKVKSRKPGQDHFNAKQTGNNRLKKKKSGNFPISAKTLKRFLPYS